MNSGEKFRQAMQAEKPLQLVGTVNAYSALMAKEVGYLAIYLSGASVANNSYGVPDIGITCFEQVLEDAKRIVQATDLPLIVDIDTGFENEFEIAHVIQTLNKIGVAGVQIEDQTADKRCGHLEGKKLITKEEMYLKIQGAVSAKLDKEFVIIARTDALSLEDIQGTILRGLSYKQAGADILFIEAATTLDQYAAIKKAVQMPILANITEFGKTPLFTSQELLKADVDIALYPLSASRAMNLAALKVYRDIREHGTQKKSIPEMQTRKELYHFLNYQEGIDWTK